MSKRYAGAAAFYVVYIREAHPTDGWSLASNEREGIKLAQTRTAPERQKAAQCFCDSRPVTIPVLVDGVDNAVEEAYSGFPDRLYVIDRHGRVAYKGGRGPMGFDPAGLEQALILTLLADEPREF